MSQQDIPISEEAATKTLDTATSVETIAPDCEMILEINREIKDLILDYTLWAAILGAFASNYLRLDDYTLQLTNNH